MRGRVWVFPNREKKKKEKERVFGYSNLTSLQGWIAINTSFSQKIKKVVEVRLFLYGFY